MIDGIVWALAAVLVALPVIAVFVLGVVLAGLIL
jgi:hypothetical protein